jgi:hypothetical protein
MTTPSGTQMTATVDAILLDACANQAEREI